MINKEVIKPISLYILVISISSILFSIIEKHSLLDSLWWSIVTASTVGYGDIYPVTLFGKVLGISLIFITYGTMFFIADKLIKDRNEFTHEEQEWIKKQLKQINNKLK